MRIIELITERRSNPDLNPRISVIDVIKQYQSNADTLPNGTANLFISMTELDKLGINPAYGSGTPVGLYSYPSDYVIKVANKTMDDLPYAGDQPYINIFRIKNPDKIIYLNSISQEQCQYYIDKLKKIVGEDRVTRAQMSTGLIQHPGKALWNITLNVAKKFPNTWVMWNTLFRKLGVDGCVDDGEGIIHLHEMTQSVFFSTNAIILIDRLKNIHDTDKSDRGKSIQRTVDQLKQMGTDERVNLLVNLFNNQSHERVLLKLLPKNEQHQVMSQIGALHVFTYMVRIAKRPIPEFEPHLQNSYLYVIPYMELFKIRRLWPGIEEDIAHQPEYAYRYASVTNTRFPAGERAISKDWQLAELYDTEFGTNLSNK